MKKSIFLSNGSRLKKILQAEYSQDIFWGEFSARMKLSGVGYFTPKELFMVGSPWERFSMEGEVYFPALFGNDQISAEKSIFS